MFNLRLVRVSFVAASLWCQTVPAEAQVAVTDTVAGVVVDADGRPIADVEVEVRDDNGRVARSRSAADGRFVVAGLAAGPGRVTALAQAWTPATTDVTIPTEGAGLQITLVPAGIEETVVVIGVPSARSALHLGSQDLLGSVDVIGADQLQRENVDLSYELLKKVPGVYVTDYNQSVEARVKR